MYYISKPNQPHYSRVVKRLSDMSRAQPEEGSEWHVRKRRQIRAFDHLAVYFWRNGKLVRCPQKSEVILF